MEDFLITLLNSLETIEVKGKSNLDTLLGCMMAIEREIARLEETEAEDG